MTTQKPAYFAMELILNLKKKLFVFLTCLWFLKKSVLKFLDHTVYFLFASFHLNDRHIIECCLYLSVCQGLGIVVMGLIYTKVVVTGYWVTESGEDLAHSVAAAFSLHQSLWFHLALILHSLTA
jgi:hypothetical protein